MLWNEQRPAAAFLGLVRMGRPHPRRRRRRRRGVFIARILLLSAWCAGGSRLVSAEAVIVRDQLRPRLGLRSHLSSPWPTGPIGRRCGQTEQLRPVGRFPPEPGAIRRLGAARRPIRRPRQIDGLHGASLGGWVFVVHGASTRPSIAQSELGNETITRHIASSAEYLRATVREVGSHEGG